MHSSLPLSASAAIALAFLSFAQGSIYVVGIDDGFSYRATLPDKPSGVAANITGFAQATLWEFDNSTKLNVILEGIPVLKNKNTKILYSINEHKINDGDCEHAGSAINPDVGTVSADSEGVVGSADVEAFETNTEEQPLNLKAGDKYFIGDRSFVVQYDNGTIIACANFELRGKPPAELAGSESRAPKSSHHATSTATGSEPSATGDSKGDAIAQSPSLMAVVVAVGFSLLAFGW